MLNLSNLARSGPGRSLGLTGLALAALLLATLSGCGGCRQQTPMDKEKQKAAEKKPKPKPDFEPLKLSIEPADRQVLLRACKPGHWVAAALDAKANNFDFTGDIDAGPTDLQGKPLNLEQTPFRFVASRPATLSKGSGKQLELALFVPRGRSKTWITTRLLDRHSGREAKREMEQIDHMPAYQYFLLVLAREPDRYRYLKVLPSVRPPWDDMSGGGDDYYYRVLTPHVGQSVVLPSQSLFWSSLAVIVWDDIDPSVLNAEQQQALVDWLHWGGQLVVSGPQTLDLLGQSFLEPYLPAVTAGSTQLDAASLKELNQQWTIGGSETSTKPLALLAPWAGVKLQERPGGTLIEGTGGLLAERRVGRGRIVVSAFRLNQGDLLKWPSFDSFVNNCLLRRPPRRFIRGRDESLQVEWLENGAHRFESTLITNLRYFSRDARLSDSETDVAPPPELDDQQKPTPISVLGGYLVPNDAQAEESRRMNEAKSGSGANGWNDFAGVASLARNALKEAAGITIPRREFVLEVLTIYLVVLVPLNWLVCRLLGRIEWAWVAVPLIAVFCAGAVIWAAQLDIGFARSSTEIAVLELHGGYARGHVTRYTALYTSLSTQYEANFVDPSAVALPFPTEVNFHLLSGQSRSTVNYRRDNEVHLTGIVVASNSTGMLHSEHMFDLGGSVRYEEQEQRLPRIINDSRFALLDVGVLRKPDHQANNDRLEIAWLGTLAAGDSAPLVFSANKGKPFETERERAVITASDRPRDTLSLKTLVELAQDPAQLSPGDVRLVAWIEDELPGVRIEPAAAQKRHATLAVVHLRHGLGSQPVPDATLPALATRPVEEEEEKLDFQTDQPYK